MDGVKLSGVPLPQDSEHQQNLPHFLWYFWPILYCSYSAFTNFILPFVTCSRYASGQVLIHIVCRAVRSRGNWAAELQTKVPEDYAKISQSRRRPLLGSWLKALTSTFTFKTLWRHYAKTSCNLSEALFEALVVAHVSTEISNFTSIYLNISKWV